MRSQALRERAQALAARLQAQQAAAPAHRPAPGCGPPRSRHPLDDPATDPARWLGFC